MMNRRTGVSNAGNTDSNHNHNKKVEREKEEEESRSKSIQGTGCESKKKVSDLRQTAMSKHIETRKKIRDIAEVSSFNDLLDQTTLSDDDKKLLFLFYIKHKDFRYIGDTLGYSESTIKRRHKKALQKISKIL